MSGPRLSSQNVVAVDPDSLTVAPCPMSRPPDVIGAADVITRAASVIRPIANLDRDSAWVRAIARATSVPGSITTPIIRSVTRIPSVMLLFASDYTERNRKQKQEEEHRPFPYRFRSISGGDRLLLRAINNLHLHTNHIRIRQSFHAPELQNALKSLLLDYREAVPAGEPGLRKDPPGSFGLAPRLRRGRPALSFSPQNGGTLGCRCADAENLRYHADADALTPPESCARFDQGEES